MNKAIEIYIFIISLINFILSFGLMAYIMYKFLPRQN